MKRFGKFLAIVSVGVMTAVAPMTTANAQGVYGQSDVWSQREGTMAGDPRSFPQWQFRNGGHQYRNNGHNFRGVPRHSKRVVRHHNRRGNNDGLAIGLGIAAGALALGVIANSQRNYRVQPQPHVTRSSGMAPWSPGWYRYCDQKYRSFNASTGTYRGYDGYDHFCVAN